MIFAGQLNEKLKFYSVHVEQSPSGFKHREESFMFEEKAERTKNKEHFEVNGEELYHSNFLTFRLRYRREITEECIVEYYGKKYMIDSIQPYPRDNEMIIVIVKINE